MAKRIHLNPQLDKDIKKGIAWSVHAFTTFGIVADLHGDGFEEIVFRTLHGHLVIMSGSGTTPQILYRHGEGGIIDLVVGNLTPPVNPWLKRPIYLLSARGHVVRLEIDPSATGGADAGRLAAASPLQYGGLRDLDIVPYQGEARLAGLFVPHPAELKAVRFFSFDTCTPTGGFGNVVVPHRQSHASATGADGRAGGAARGGHCSVAGGGFGRCGDGC